MQKTLVKTFTATLAAFIIFRIATPILKLTDIDYIPTMFIAEGVLLAAGLIAASITKKMRHRSERRL